MLFLFQLIAQFRPVRNAQLPVRILQMPLHRVQANMQLIGNQLVGITLLYKLVDSPLRSRQVGELVLLSGGRHPGVRPFGNQVDRVG